MMNEVGIVAIELLCAHGPVLGVGMTVIVEVTRTRTVRGHWEVAIGSDNETKGSPPTSVDANVGGWDIGFEAAGGAAEAEGEMTGMDTGGAPEVTVGREDIVFEAIMAEEAAEVESEATDLDCWGAPDAGAGQEKPEKPDIESVLEEDGPAKISGSQVCLCRLVGCVIDLILCEKSVIWREMIGKSLECF
jgi:hypothetical protein